MITDITDWQFWGSLAAARLPLGLILRPMKVKKRAQMSEVSGSAYVFRMFDLMFGLRCSAIMMRLTEEEKKVLNDFTSAFDALPWRPLATHPHISELTNGDFTAVMPFAKRLDRRLWLRVGRGIIPILYRIARGWKIAEPAISKKEKIATNDS